MVIIETSVFSRHVASLLTEDEYRFLQLYLAENPGAGVVIRGSGGIRKLRWALQGRGKRGGARVIYYWATGQGQILMLALYGKNEQTDLTPEQLRILSQVVKEEYS